MPAITMDQYLQYAGSLVAVIALILVVLWLLRRITATGGMRRGPRRLEVLEIQPVDPKRRLILVRRDDTQHLLLIGGESDLVVEPNIMSPSEAETLPEPGSFGRMLASGLPRPRPGSGSGSGSGTGKPDSGAKASGAKGSGSKVSGLRIPGCKTKDSAQGTGDTGRKEPRLRSGPAPRKAPSLSAVEPEDPTPMPAAPAVPTVRDPAPEPEERAPAASLADESAPDFVPDPHAPAPALDQTVRPKAGNGLEVSLSDPQAPSRETKA
ncbi:MAG: flagellar biosynthetic protein FliO [Rhodospirillaceae bacterium]